jgi:type II secretion system protein H
MPILALGPCRAGHRLHRQTGFTLIEILVVMAIVATGLSVVSFSFNALEAREERQEGQRLARLLQMTLERAEVRGTPLALERLADGYRFLTQHTDGRWRLLKEGGVWREHRFPKEVRWGMLNIEGMEHPWPAPLELLPRPRRFHLELRTQSHLHIYEGRETGSVAYHVRPRLE